MGGVLLRNVIPSQRVSARTDENSREIPSVRETLSPTQIMYTVRIVSTRCSLQRNALKMILKLKLVCNPNYDLIGRVYAFSIF